MTGPARQPANRGDRYSHVGRSGTGLQTANSLSDGAGLRKRAPTRRSGARLGSMAWLSRGFVTGRYAMGKWCRQRTQSANGRYASARSTGSELPL
jgi:hypothetical protein